MNGIFSFGIDCCTHKQTTDRPIQITALENYLICTERRVEKKKRVSRLDISTGICTNVTFDKRAGVQSIF